MLSDKRVHEIIMEEISALDFFNDLNSKNSDLTPWDAETKMERMKPGNAACAKYIPPKGDFKLHTYNDWVKNYKPRGISYQEYMKIKL